MALGAGSPIVESLLPRGGQRGTEVAVEFRGQRLDKAFGVVFHQDGIQLAKLEPIDGGRVKAVLRIAADAPRGLQALRLRTAQGLSNLVLFSVGALPELAEAEPNGERAQAQMIAPPVTINGAIENEDVDCFGFEAKQGQVIAFEVEGMRLGDTLFDPRLAVYDHAGKELLVADDTMLVGQDAAGTVTIPADGKYVVEVRETAYGGDGRCHYRLHVGAFPRPVAALPAGGAAGSEVDVQWIGDPSAGTQKVKLPEQPADDFVLWPQLSDVLAPSPVPFRLINLPTTIEKEPNNGDAEATPMTVPGGVSGVIAAEGDTDCFVFEAKKGQAFEASVFARRLRSPLDSVLNVRRQDGAGVGDNDDSAGPDSVVRFTCPEDGKYVLQVGDRLRRGRPEYTYFLEVAPVVPSLRLSMLPENGGIALAPGNRAAALVTASRADFGGPLVLSAEGVPAGVTMSADTMSDSVSQVPVVFEAAPEVRPATQPATQPTTQPATQPTTQPSAATFNGLVDLHARHADPNVKIEGWLRQTLELTKFQNQAIYATSVDRLALALTEPVPFKINIVEPKVPIVRRGMMELPIHVERTGDFKGDVHVRMLWVPPGVGAGTTRIAGDQNEGFIHLDANEGARIGKWKMVAVATTDLGGGPFEVASQLTTLEVAEPFLEFVVQKARTELGKPVEMLVSITQKVPFDGAAQAELIGLPSKVATTQAAVEKDTPAVKYTLQVPTSAPAGRYGGVFVRAVVTRDGQPIVHQSAPGELTLDKPLPPKDPEEEARRAEAKRKAEEEKARKKAERLAAAEQRRAERAKQQAAPKSADGK